MSTEFDDGVRLAAECYVEHHGLEAAIAELQERREPGGDNERVNEALAYLKRENAREDTDL
jgi:hypothetical protein